MEVSRKRLQTYSRSNKRILVHDLFNVAQKEPSSYETLHAPAVGQVPSSRTSTPFSEVSEDAETSQQLRQELSAFANASSSAGKPATPRSKSATPAEASSPSLFDLESSEDDMRSKSAAEKLKRKKLGAKSGNVHEDTPKATASPASPVTKAATSKSPKSASVGKRSQQRGSAQKKRSIPKKKHTDMKAAARESTAEFWHDGVRSTHLVPHLNSSQETPPDIGSPVSDKSAGSMLSSRSTPKRKRHADEEVLSDLSSPSQLELSSLRLTPNRRSKARARSNDSKATEQLSSTPSKSRERLIDRLDSPPSKPTVQDLDMIDASPRPSKSRKLLSPVNRALDKDQNSTVTESSERPLDTVGGSEQVPPRQRTYGRQRSHLKSMVPELSSQADDPSQHSLQDLVSQVESLTGSKSQFEIDDDSEDEDAGPKLKSIHELRHAGLASRLDRELEALFEDVESKHKALRIQGLMSLVRKLQEKKFRSHILAGSSIGRLVGVVSPDLDLTSSTILVLGLWALAVAETATVQALSQIYDCLLQLPPAVFAEQRTISKIAKDRKENLAKALVRDLADFEQHVLDKSVKHEGQVDHILISRVSLRCLELTLRRIIALAGRATDSPVAVFDIVLDCIKHNLEEIANHGDRPDLAESIRLQLSWLELTAASSVNIGQTMPTRLLEDLGTVLSEVMRWARTDYPTIQQSSIRVAVELSNGSPAICLRFASTPLLSAAFDVIVDHFSQLVTTDGAGQTAPDNLNSVILALGALLNFADCSEEAREKVMAVDTLKGRQVDHLVNIFNTFVDEVAEASPGILSTYVSTDFCRQLPKNVRKRSVFHLATCACCFVPFASMHLSASMSRLP